MADDVGGTVNRRSRSAADRVALMLSIVPWIAARDGPSLDEICAHFDIERERLLSDLNVLPFVGLPPYSPDMLIEVTVSDDRVWVRLPDVFSRPLRLTPQQALGLVAAGAAAGAASGSAPGNNTGPLATGVKKLASLLGIEADEAVTVQLGHSDPAVLDLLRDAVARRRQVQLDYFSYSRNQRRERTVDPYRVFAEGGAWYLYGHCHRVGDARLFRLDRIFGAERLDSHFERGPEADEQPAVFGAEPDAPRVTLSLAPEARWVVEQYPVESSEQTFDGRTLARLAVASRPWLEKLLLRLGDAAEVVDSTDPSLREVRKEAAARVLHRYNRG